MPVAAAAWPSHVDSGTGVTLTAVAIPSGAAWSLAAARGGAGVAAMSPAPAWPITQKENAALAQSTKRLKTTKRFTRSTDQSNHHTPAVRRYHQAWAGRITLSRAVPVQVRPLYAINGDRDLAYQGDPETGEPVAGITGTALHSHHLWRVADVRELAADQREPATFFCGGSRNLASFIDLFDAVFVLEPDVETLRRRLDQRPPDEWGGQAAERQLIEQ